ncbi:VOC family protein [Mycolicibacterium brumae]|uniref:VOC family protein n=1 Tax=Mycolicibacterium brumae TaxID=85968 RepID=A0A2G5PG06_9MYCO|nr:VOC family protein [Mycolicibacterium brumae]MCV7194353.1 VOC family protein [Mycolicibacterium brumae]PIB77249.1 VOC family protein [Mycolicibacterium brumae]UWW10610.1 VOC family protein [Mycolicibacterium brumae]
MSVRLVPYVSFPGNGREVLDYYTEIFGGSLNTASYTDFPMEGMPFTPPADALAHGHLDAGAVQLAGGDWICPENPADPLENNAYSFLLELDSTDEAEALIEKFTSTGSEVAMPFEKAPWGGHYGQVKDKFGVLWAFSVEG